MDNKYYSKERNAQIVLALLKQFGIKKVIASPGTTNIAVVGSMMNDPYFEMFSAPDERSAAYMACGMAAESGQVVVLTCTGATASRNYIPGLTEAFYRKLPVLALTSSFSNYRSGHLFPQFVDRTQQLKDMVYYSAQIPAINTKEDEWNCVVKVNEALLELKRNGGGPVHLNLITQGELYDFSVKQLPTVRKIERFQYTDQLPDFPSGRIGIFVGSHAQFSEELTKSVDKFCEKYDAVVFCDHTSGYKGKYRVLYSIVATQKIHDENITLDLLIHIGEISGDYFTQPKFYSAKQVWRISEDGQIRDYFKKTTCVFQMKEEFFFEHYSVGQSSPKTCHFDDCKNIIRHIYSNIPELPFSNIWIASVISTKLPENSVIHFGILNSLRAWNFFEIPNRVCSYSNVGGFGIDGGLSTLLGASFVNKEKLYFGVFGDLAFFYDINSLGNRHVGNNVRIMLINNGKGTEFRHYTHPGSKFEDRADEYIAAGGHYGNKSTDLVKHYATDLGFHYLCASTKEEFLSTYKEFIDEQQHECPLIFEIFTNHEDESNALKAINTIMADNPGIIQTIKESTANIIKNVIGEEVVKAIKAEHFS
jgi:2-succinyl-5-enolpyruvyl-6-hydroxy-3-cyclohexene-1-carboxylate synthase